MLSRPRAGAAAIALAVAGLAAACHRGDSGNQAPQLTVSVSPVVSQPIPIYMEHVGQTEAVNTVEVRARVRGNLERVLFKEGADVHEGDLLFVIEQKPYKAAFDRAKADLEKAKASLARAEADFQRTAQLAKKEVSSQAELDHARATRDESTASVESMRAALEQAELDLGYTEVRAPLTGRIGRLSVNQGNLVGGNEETVLATIVQLDPIYLYWSPSEKERLDVLRQRKEGKFVQRDEIEVRAVLADGSEHPYPGRLDFVDNSVDPSAGTLRVRAVFPNPDKSLLPGQYAKLRVLVGRDVPALLVPSAAIIEEQGGSTVFVVGSDGVVETRAVTATGVHEQSRVIESGLTEGEKVVTDNLGKLRPGMKVSLKLAEATPAK
jgi:RND family efflux transporter MFP subunit